MNARRPLCLLALLWCACGVDRESEYRRALALPASLEVPALPDENPPTLEKRELGRRLFYELRLSGNQTQSCASCHQQGLAFTDGLPKSIGSTGHTLRRNSQALVNAAYNTSFTWASDVLLTLEDQLEVPIRNDRPVELGVLDGNVFEVLARFDGDVTYARAFAEAFPESASGATLQKIILSLATFCRSLASADSPFDRYVAGDLAALSDSQKRGMELFNGERLECFHCHSGTNLTVSYRDLDTTEGTVSYPFFNNGLYNVGDDASYPPDDQGLYELTLRRQDRGRFRPASLRNVALTAPYMHDGSIATLSDVVRHYAAGGRNFPSGPLAGDGRRNPLKSGLVRGFDISDSEVADVVAFLESLTDASVLDNPAFSAPN